MSNKTSKQQQSFEYAYTRYSVYNKQSGKPLAFAEVIHHNETPFDTNAHETSSFMRDMVIKSVASHESLSIGDIRAPNQTCPQKKEEYEKIMEAYKGQKLDGRVILDNNTGAPKGQAFIIRFADVKEIGFREEDTAVTIMDSKGIASKFLPLSE